MRQLRQATVLLLLLCGISAYACAQQTAASAQQPRISSTKEKDIRRLLDLMGVIKKEVRSIGPVFETYKRSAPQVPDNVWEELKSEFTDEFSPENIAAWYVPIYDKHFDAAEVKQLIRFYESPAGRKMVVQMPLIEAEAYLSGFEKGKRLGERVRERLKAKGYNIPVA